jgi:carbon monoxide dehydrogenase subunit G
VIVDRSIRITAPADETFRRCVDIPFVGSCLPGATDVEPDGPQTYRGRFGVKVGPVAVTLQGTVRIMESDEQARTALLRLQGSDRRIGGDVVGDMRIGVVEQSAEESQLDVHTDVTISGKLGQFGQAVIVKKADQITEAFVREFSRQLAEAPAGNGAQPPAQPTPPHPEVQPEPQPEPAAAATATPAAERAGAAAAPPSTGAAAADPHAVTALFRRSRRLTLVRGQASALDLRGAAPLWLAVGADGAAATGPRIVEVAAADETELSARLPRGDRSGGPVVVAIRPRGPAVGDVEAITRLGRAAAAARHPVLLVATTPWSALPCARAAAVGAAHGVAVLLDAPSDAVPALLAVAVAEIRAAGLLLPVVAGPVTNRTAATLLERGVDGVVVAPARSRVASAVRRLPGRRA